MKIHLRTLTLSTLAFALVPLAQANADTVTTVFDSATQSWSQTATNSTSGAGGSTTLSFQASAPSNNPPQATDYFNLPTAITTGSGVWTFDTTLTFNTSPTNNPSAQDVYGIAVGFGNFTSTSVAVNSGGGTNGTGGPWAQWSRSNYLTADDINGSVLHGGMGSAPGSFLANNNIFANISDLKIVLDTTNPQWVVSLFVNGVLDESFNYTGNPSATGIGIGTTYQGGDASSITFGETTLTDTVTAAVPEPSTWAMMVLGFAGVGFLSYRRTRRNGGLTLRLA